MYFGKRTPCTVLVGTIALALLIGVAQATMIPQSTPQLTANSSHIVRGEVTSISSHWNEQETYIYTLITVRPIESFKAATELPGEITLWAPGGQVGELKLWVEHTPTFERGQDVILFLEDRGENFDITSWAQGKFTIENDVVLETNESLASFTSRIAEAVNAEQPKDR